MKTMAVYLLLIISITGFVTADEIQPVLKVDNGGHMGIIRDVTKTSDNRFIITCSDDKMVKVWDTQTGRETDKILGWIGDGVEGMPLAIAISPDDRWLAVAGLIENYTGKEYHPVRIYDFKTGTLKHLLYGHPGSVGALDFNSDGSLLASGCNNDIIFIWDVNGGFTQKDKLEYHGKEVNDVAFFNNSGLEYLVSGSNDKRIYLYSINSGQVVTSFKSTNTVDSIAVSNRYIAATSQVDNSIYIFDHQLSLVQKIKAPVNSESLSFSPDNSRLLSGAMYAPYTNYVFDVNSGFKEVTSIKTDGFILASLFLDNRTAVVCGGQNKEIYFWDTVTNKFTMTLKGHGIPLQEVAYRDSTVAYATSLTTSYAKRTGSFEKEFSLDDMQIAAYTGKTSRNSLPVKQGAYSLATRQGGPFNYNRGVLVLSKDGIETTTIELNASNGLEHYTYGFAPDGTILSGGSHGHLKAYDVNGKVLHSLVGHTGLVTGLSTDDGLLVSCSEDLTFKIWDLDKLQSKDKTILPMLNIFVSEDEEWVTWVNEGYYNSSVGGDRFIGYHVNQGKTKEALFYSSDKFFNTYFRPDIISNVVKLRNLKKAIAYANRTNRVEEVKVENILPPVIQVINPEVLSFKTAEESVVIDFNVIPVSNEKVSEIMILLNGRQLSERGLDIKPKSGQDVIRVSKTITLTEQQNTITIIARNRFAASNPVSIRVGRKKSVVKNLFKPDLYLLSIGVSEYQNSAFNLNFAAKDAKSIAVMFEKQKGSLYKDVKKRVLTNDEANKDNILDGLDWLMKEATQHDVVVLFIAGHGVNDDNSNYYFLAHEADLEKLRRTGIRWLEFQDIISNLPSKVILMADTCHSGNIIGNTRRDITGALKSLISSGTGQIIMTASTGNSYSLEDPSWGHGAFTKAVLEAIEGGKGDYDNNRKITIKELDLFVTTKVKELTGGKQKPTTIIPGSIPDFPFGVLQ
jgi:WD40 repeat protein